MKWADFWPAKGAAAFLFHSDADQIPKLALGFAAAADGRVRVFEIQSDFPRTDQWQLLESALVNCENIVLYSRRRSKFLVSLANFFADSPWQRGVTYCWNGEKIEFPKLMMSRLEAPSILALTSFIEDHQQAHRPLHFFLSPELLNSLGEPKSQSSFQVVKLGALLDANTLRVTFRDLCFLHHRDLQPDKAVKKASAEHNGSGYSWTYLQEVLSHDPTYKSIDRISTLLTKEQNLFAQSAIHFLEEARAAEEERFPDIYELVWGLRRISGSYFRGQKDRRWPLIATLLRPTQDCTFLELATLRARTESTISFLESLQARQDEFFENTPTEEELLAVAQHYEFPTPLLDFTKSIFVAAFFATCGNHSTEETIGVIYELPKRISQYPEREEESDLNLRDLLRIRTGNFIEVSPRLKLPANRIERQQGVFVMGHRGTDLASVGLTAHYFRQIPGVLFEDSQLGITRDKLLPLDCQLSKLAKQVRCSKELCTDRPTDLLGQTIVSIRQATVGFEQCSEPQVDRLGQLLNQSLQHAENSCGIEFHQKIRQIALDYFLWSDELADLGSAFDSRYFVGIRDPLPKALERLGRGSELGLGDEQHVDIQRLISTLVVTGDVLEGWRLRDELKDRSPEWSIALIVGLVLCGCDSIKKGDWYKTNCFLNVANIFNVLKGWLKAN